MLEIVVIILALMAGGAGSYAFYLAVKLKNRELEIVVLKTENEKLKTIVMPKQPPTLIKQVKR